MIKELGDYPPEVLEKAIVATDILTDFRDFMTVRLANDFDAFRISLHKALGDRGGEDAGQT